MLQPILNVNLTTGSFEPLRIPDAWVLEYYGGASLAARLLFEALTPDLDPLSPQAPLLFMNGPLSGTSGPAVGRFVVCGKSPATGRWGEANCGGFWGPELRKAGFDGLLLTGAATSPTALWILDGDIQLRPAGDLWGMDPYAVQRRVAEQSPALNPRVASIGIAGENRVPYALILCDHGRVAGRTGMGAVMGSKNLKAIVVKGRGEVPLVDPAGYQPLRSEANRQLRTHNQTTVLRELGTASGADYFDYLGELPKKYYQSGAAGHADSVSGCTVSETILKGVSACHACVIACGRVVDLEDGRGRRKGGEYETMAGLGPNLLIDDMAAITRLGERCDVLGVDSISMGNTIGLAFKLFDDGVITVEDTGGLALEWGSVRAAERCIDLAARKEGFGALLALGARGLARQFGCEEEAVQVNGLEAAYHDPRGASGLALTYATSPRGACHNQSDYYIVDAFGQVDESLGIEFRSRHAGAEKARDVAIHQDWRTVNNALVLCIFASVPTQSVAELLSAALGVALSVEDLLQSGARGWNLKRMINLRLGLRRSDDRLPKAFLKPLPDGGSAGFVPDLEGMLSAYYEARNWDPATGVPRQALLNDLGLDWAASATGGFPTR